MTRGSTITPYDSRFNPKIQVLRLSIAYDFCGLGLGLVSNPNPVTVYFLWFNVFPLVFKVEGSRVNI